jgi:hypothetical protein
LDDEKRQLTDKAPRVAAEQEETAADGGSLGDTNTRDIVSMEIVSGRRRDEAGHKGVNSWLLLRGVHPAVRMLLLSLTTTTTNTNG